MPTQASWTFKDYAAENSRTTVNLEGIDGTTRTIADAETERDAVQTAIAAVTNGTISNRNIAVSEKLSNTLPTNNAVQRENKILVTYEDTVTFALYRLEIPTIDFSALTFKTNTDEIELADGGVMADLVTALEANAVAPVTENAIAVLRADFVSRNL